MILAGMAPDPHKPLPIKVIYGLGIIPEHSP